MKPRVRIGDLTKLEMPLVFGEKETLEEREQRLWDEAELEETWGSPIRTFVGGAVQEIDSELDAMLEHLVTDLQIEKCSRRLIERAVAHAIHRSEGVTNMIYPDDPVKAKEVFIKILPQSIKIAFRWAVSMKES